MDINKKLEVLSKIAAELNKEKITWAVGASLLLYFKNKTDKFNDIDIMVAEEDVEKLKEVMGKMGTLAKPNPHAKYKTRHFLEYTVEGVEVDVMAGFVIVNNGKDYECPLLKEDIKEHIEVNGESIPLHSLKCWERYYTLMGREEKVRMINA